MGIVNGICIESRMAEIFIAVKKNEDTLEKMLALCVEIIAVAHSKAGQSKKKMEFFDRHWFAALKAGASPSMI